jgi:hypothetical protein
MGKNRIELQTMPQGAGSYYTIFKLRENDERKTA